ncbi:MAG: GtrA family protein [Bacteroidales bacterium]|nr:GtrA family protein [Bacteroidales bacterium]
MEETTKNIKMRGKGILLFLKASVSSQIASWVDMGLSFILFSVVNLTLYDGFFAKAIGAATGGVINCCINYKWTFRPEGCSKRTVAVKYAMVWLGSLLLNSFGTAFVTGFVSDLPILAEWGVSKDSVFFVAQLAVSLVVSICWNFMLQRYFVFNNVKIKAKVKKVTTKLKHNNGE